MVNQNQTFENLWNNAILQQDKISSVEAGVDPDQVKVLSNPMEIWNTYIDLINSANEISLIIATPNALQRNYKAGIIHMLTEAAEKGTLMLI